MSKKQFFIVSAEALPEVFLKVAEVKRRLQGLDVNSITPLEALGILAELKKKVD